MKKIINYIKKTCIFLGIILMIAAISSLLNTIGVPKKITSTTIFIFQIILFFIIGYIHGKKTKKKAIIEEIIVSSILILIMLFLSLIMFNYSFKLSNFVYYIILISTCTFAGILGKNKK